MRQAEGKYGGPPQGNVFGPAFVARVPSFTRSAFPAFGPVLDVRAAGRHRPEVLRVNGGLQRRINGALIVSGLLGLGLTAYSAPISVGFVFGKGM